jgi:hypothetical protein
MTVFQCPVCESRRLRLRAEAGIELDLIDWSE